MSPRRARATGRRRRRGARFAELPGCEEGGPAGRSGFGVIGNCGRARSQPWTSGSWLRDEIRSFSNLLFDPPKHILMAVNRVTR